LPILPDQVIPGVKYYLVDFQERCSFPIKTGLNTVGRLSSNNIVLQDIWISRRHCVLLAHARGGCELHDTASLNGTWPTRPDSGPTGVGSLGPGMQEAAALHRCGGRRFGRPRSSGHGLGLMPTGSPRGLIPSQCWPLSVYGKDVSPIRKCSTGSGVANPSFPLV
jgi:hypothetical protein